ncbi:hypothetical protein KC19_2G287600 [Ceratodon purpureus]|uniref:Large ribosomal subunit protein uL5c n=1 Tax=Ceratodon purpureus TaxID=3225 RepID=A0A8T0J0B5_CERPU|nr:hypothetical protein KC19_2G287600 [Ceratodon purpureus]
MAAMACTAAAATASLVASTSACTSSTSSALMGSRVAVAPVGARRLACRGAVAVSASAAVAVEDQTEERTVQRLLGIYQEKVVPAMQEEFKYGNKFEIPHVKKIIVNCGVGEASQNAKALEGTIRDIALVTGQKSVVTRSRKAIAGFKLREGVPVGVTLTLRGDMMYSFLDRLLNLALPRTRDFQGVNPYSFDGRGNYTLGLPEISVFPEIKFENIDKQRGMDICIVTTAKNDSEGLKLLELMGMPFKEMGGGRMSASAAKKATRTTFRGRRR